MRETDTTVRPDGRDRSRSRTRRWPTVVAVAALVGVVALAFTSGFVSELSDREQLESTVQGAGAWGPMLFVALMVALVPLNVPGILFVLPATTLFGTGAGVALSLLGGFLASAVGIVAARQLGRDVFQARMPERVLRMEARMSRRGFWGVAGVRSVTFLLQPVDWLCGLSRMPMRTVLGGTFVGLIPPTLVIALSGGGVLDLLLPG